MAFTVSVTQDGESVHVYQIGQTVEYKLTPGPIGTVVGVVVDVDRVANVVEWADGRRFTYTSNLLQLASEDGER